MNWHFLQASPWKQNKRLRRGVTATPLFAAITEGIISPTASSVLLSPFSPMGGNWKKSWLWLWLYYSILYFNWNWMEERKNEWMNGMNGWTKANIDRKEWHYPANHYLYSTKCFGYRLVDILHIIAVVVIVIVVVAEFLLFGIVSSSYLRDYIF